VRGLQRSCASSPLAKLKGVKDIEIAPTNVPEVPRMLILKVEPAAFCGREAMSATLLAAGARRELQAWRRWRRKSSWPAAPGVFG